MCIGPIKTTENEIGAAPWGRDPGGRDFGVAYWRGVDSIINDCGNTREVLTPRVVGVAASIYTTAGLIVDEVGSEMRLYLVDTREMDAVYKGRDAAAFLAVSGILKKKFIGGFYPGDISKREIYATNFGGGFASSTPQFGGSQTTYGVICLWRALEPAGVNGLMMVDWGFETSKGAAT